MASALKTAAQTVLSTVTDTAKVADLQRDIVDPSKRPTKSLTTDHGVFVSNTDNWYVLVLHAYWLAKDYWNQSFPTQPCRERGILVLSERIYAAIVSCSEGAMLTDMSQAQGTNQRACWTFSAGRSGKSLHIPLLSLAHRLRRRLVAKRFTDSITSASLRQVVCAEYLHC